MEKKHLISFVRYADCCVSVLSHWQNHLFSSWCTDKWLWSTRQREGCCPVVKWRSKEHHTTGDKARNPGKHTYTPTQPSCPILTVCVMSNKSTCLPFHSCQCDWSSCWHTNTFIQSQRERGRFLTRCCDFSWMRRLDGWTMSNRSSWRRSSRRGGSRRNMALTGEMR